MNHMVKFVFVLSILVLPVGLLAQGRGPERPVNPPEGGGRGHSKKDPVAVPEPSTLLLMAAAGALGGRKLWQKLR